MICKLFQATQLVDFDIKASIEEKWTIERSPNMHIFHAFEHCEVNISVLVDPRNAKRVLALYPCPSVETEQVIFIALSLVPRPFRLSAMVC